MVHAKFKADWIHVMKIPTNIGDHKQNRLLTAANTKNSLTGTNVLAQVSRKRVTWQPLAILHLFFQ